MNSKHSYRNLYLFVFILVYQFGLPFEPAIAQKISTSAVIRDTASRPYTVSMIRALSDKYPEQIMTRDYGGGTWYLDNKDTSSPDNTGTVLVTKSGKRYKRAYRDAVDIEWFGAVGYTNDTPVIDSRKALQEAFDAVGDHGILHLPSDKQYYVSGTVYIDHFNVKVIGDANVAYLPTIRAKGDYPIFHVRNAGFSCQNVSFQGTGKEFVQGNNIYSPQGTGILLDRDDGSHKPDFANIDAKIDGCLFNYLNQGISCRGRNLFLFNSDFSNCLNGVRIDQVAGSDCRGHQIIKNRFHSNGFGEYAVPSESWCVVISSPAAFGNVIKDNVIDGKSRGFYKGGLNQTSISGNQFTMAYGDLIHIIDPAGIFWYGWAITNNVISGIPGALPASGAVANYGIYSEGIVQNGLIENNQIAFVRKDGMHFANLTSCLVSGNYILTPNKIETDSSNYDGIFIGSGSANQVTNNFIRSTRSKNIGYRYGINDQSTGSGFGYNFVDDHKMARFNNERPEANKVADETGNTNSNMVAEDADYAPRLTSNAYTSSLIKLPSITANRTIDLSGISGDALSLWNQNTSTFYWSFSTPVIDTKGNKINTVPNGTLIELFRDGKQWVKK